MDKIRQFHELGKNSHHLVDLLLRSYGYISNISHSKLFPVFWIYLLKHCIPEILVPWYLSHGITGLKCLNLPLRKGSYRLYTPLSIESHIKIRVSGKKQKYCFRFKAHRVDKALSFPSSVEIPLSYLCSWKDLCDSVFCGNKWQLQTRGNPWYNLHYCESPLLSSLAQKEWVGYRNGKAFRSALLRLLLASSFWLVPFCTIVHE